MSYQARHHTVHVGEPPASLPKDTMSYILDALKEHELGATITQGLAWTPQWGEETTFALDLYDATSDEVYSLAWELCRVLHQDEVLIVAHPDVMISTARRSGSA